MIIQNALLLSINELMEEDVTIYINKTKIVCFESNSEYPIEVGKYYNVEFSMYECGELEVREEIEFEGYSITRLDNAWKYRINGKLENGVIKSVIDIYDEYIEYEYEYLNGCFVSFVVDRLQVSFV